MLISRLLEILERPVAPRCEHLNSSNAKYTYAVLVHTRLGSLRSALSKLRIREIWIGQSQRKRQISIKQVRMCKGRLWRRASLSVGALLGNRIEGLYEYIGDLERRMQEGSGNGASLSEGAVWGEPGRRALLLGTPKDMLRLWKWTSVSIEAPLWGNMEGRSFPRAFERREKFVYLGKFLWGILRNMWKKGPKNGQLSP